MDKKEIIESLKQAISKEIPNLRQLKYYNRKYYIWYKKMCKILETSFGKASDEYKEFSHAATFTEFSRNLPIQSNFTQRFYLDNLTKLETVLQSIIQNYELLGSEERLTTVARIPPIAFIAHEGMTKSLQKIEDFLDALGVRYLIAEIEPSDGRVIERQVQWTQGKANFAIILATKGKVINKDTGKPYMGMNVADELGRAREVFKNRIILLLQKGVEPHTNISGIVYEPFTPQNRENAFIKIIKELRNWGFIVTSQQGKE